MKFHLFLTILYQMTIFSKKMYLIQGKDFSRRIHHPCVIQGRCMLVPPSLSRVLDLITTPDIHHMPTRLIRELLLLDYKFLLGWGHYPFYPRRCSIMTGLWSDLSFEIVYFPPNLNFEFSHRIWILNIQYKFEFQLFGGQLTSILSKSLKIEWWRWKGPSNSRFIF